MRVNVHIPFKLNIKSIHYDYFLGVQDIPDEHANHPYAKNFLTVEPSEELVVTNAPSVPAQTTKTRKTKVK